jgi:hypothetical protein
MTKRVLAKPIEPLSHPMLSSASLKNGSLFTDYLSRFIENKRANISYKKDFYQTLVMEFSSCTCTSPNRINLRKGNLISFLASPLKRKHYYYEAFRIFIKLGLLLNSSDEFLAKKGNSLK